jgi:hypothetical protein
MLLIVIRRIVVNVKLHRVSALETEIRDGLPTAVDGPDSLFLLAAVVAGVELEGSFEACGSAS